MKNHNVSLLAIALAVAVAWSAGAEGRSGKSIAETKSACVADGLTAAGAAVYGHAREVPQSPVSPADIAAARERMERMDAETRSVVARCLTVDDVEALGAFSFYEASGAHCGFRRPRAVAARVVTGIDVDIVNAAASWDRLVHTGAAPPPFEAAQANSRRLMASLQAGERRTLICRNLMSGYGPNGDRLPGLIERAR